MSVLDGAREEWRRILHEGQPKWVRPEGEALRLGDGRQLAEREAVYLPPCDPTKILCIHLNYESRRVEFTLGREELAFWNLEMDETVEPAELTVWIAPDAQSGEAVVVALF